MLLLAVLACGTPPPEPEPPPEAAVEPSSKTILAAQHRFDERIALPAAFDGLIAASHDGSRFAVRLVDGSVHVFEADGTPHFVVRGNPGAARVVTWADDGSRLAIAGSERITVIDADGARVAEWSVEGLHDAALSPRGASLVVSAGSDVTWYDASTGEPRWQHPHGGGPLAFLRPQEAIVVSDGRRLRRFDRLGGVQADVEAPDVATLSATEPWLRTVDRYGQSVVRSTADLLATPEAAPWPRRMLQVAAGPEDHWLIDGRVATSALDGWSDTAFVSRDAEAGTFVAIDDQWTLWLARGDVLEHWTLWRPPRVGALPVPNDVDRVSYVGAVAGGPFVAGSDDGRVWAVPALDLGRIAWTRTLPKCPADPDLGCGVLDVGGEPNELEVATDQAAYTVDPSSAEADRVGRLPGIRGALAMPDGRWVWWNRDSVRVGPRAGRGRKVGPPLDVPHVAVAGRYHAVVWDSAIVVRNDRGRPHGKRWPIPYDAFPEAIAVAPDGNVVAAALQNNVQLFFVESGFAQAVRPAVAGIHQLEFASDGRILWASGDGVTRIVVNQAAATERWSLANGATVDRTAHHPGLSRTAGLQHGPRGPTIVLLPPR